MKRWAAAFVAVLTMGASQAAAETPVARHGALSVQDGNVVGAHGDVVSVAGPSFFWSNKGWRGERYYTPEVVRGFRHNWDAGIVRAAIGVDFNGGYPQDPAYHQGLAATVIEAAIDEGLYVIVDWHSHHAEDHVDLAVDFFEAIARRYGNAPNIVYEIYNEPLDTTDWDTVIKPYSERVIAAIRAIDPDNLIVVGTQTWSQDVDVAADNPIEGYDNIAYSLHFYAGTHGAELREKARKAMEAGLALVVTEWGTVKADASGPPDLEGARAWLDFMREHKLIHANWSAHDKVEGSSIFKPDRGLDGMWTDDDLTPSGLVVQEIVRGWEESLESE